jgi:ferrous iron transport protein A
MTLAQLKTGLNARLVEIDPELELRPRLLEMGLTPGTVLAVLRVAPLGDPIQIMVRSTRISLSKRDAAGITCQPV